jgi:hypothetical protein
VEESIEIGQVAKADLVDDRANCPVALVGIGQELVGACQSRIAEEIGECRPFRGKKGAQISWREVMPFGHGGFRQTTICQMRDDIRPYAAQSGRRDAMLL